VIDAFVTDTGVVVPAITTEQMREVDRVAIEEVGPNLFQMMENAGRSLALTAIDVLGSRWDRVSIVVLAGTGGNGGGGICAARHLANRGADVTVVITDESRLGKVPEAQLAVFRGTPGRVVEPGALASIEPGVILDTVIGYSLVGAPRGAACDFIEWANEHDAPSVSLDVPSGLDATTGEMPGMAVRAAITMTLALPKMGLAGDHVGDLWLADLGIPLEAYRRVGIEPPLGIFGGEYRVRLRPARTG
jgi:NAD(P)H-hydrate epimerase